SQAQRVKAVAGFDPGGGLALRRLSRKSHRERGFAAAYRPDQFAEPAAQDTAGQQPVDYLDTTGESALLARQLAAVKDPADLRQPAACRTIYRRRSGRLASLESGVHPLIIFAFLSYVKPGRAPRVLSSIAPASGRRNLWRAADSCGEPDYPSTTIECFT